MTTRVQLKKEREREENERMREPERETDAERESKHTLRQRDRDRTGGGKAAPEARAPRSRGLRSAHSGTSTSAIETRSANGETRATGSSERKV